MSTQTFQNDRIRVTLPSEEVDAYRKRAEYIAHMTKRDPEVEVRGLILSDAMYRLGNASEAKMLKKEVEAGPDPEEILRLAKDTLIAQYLSEHSRYASGEVYRRGTEGHVMSESMLIEWGDANAYARGCLDPLSHAAVMRIASRICLTTKHGSAKEHREFHRLKLAGGRGNEGVGEAMVEQTTLALQESAEWEAGWRERRGLPRTWQIEVIGELPSQIGMCRVQP